MLLLQTDSRMQRKHSIGVLGMPLYDLVIIGGGPAGLSAGIYGARARMNTVILEKGAVGGQAFTTREIVNFPGFRSISGPELMKSLAAHATGFGTDIVKEEVTQVDLAGDVKHIYTKKGHCYQARAVILAPGSQPRLLNIPGERNFRGSGVSYCATCDAEFYSGLDVAVVGNGDAAVEEAMYITKYARQVTIIVIHDEGIVDCNRVSAEQAFKNPKINFVWNSVLTEIKGQNEVEAVAVKNIKTGAITDLKVSGVFIYVGMVPNTQFLGEQVKLDTQGYVVANDQMETSVEGVFVAGDARIKYLRQIVTAANDGAVAAIAAERYLDEETSFKEEVLDAESFVALAFWNPAQDKHIALVSKWETIIGALGEGIKLVKVDISRKKRLAEKYGVSQCPAMIIVQKGQLLCQYTGPLDAAYLQEELTRTLAAGKSM